MLKPLRIEYTTSPKSSVQFKALLTFERWFKGSVWGDKAFRPDYTDVVVTISQIDYHKPRGKRLAQWVFSGTIQYREIRYDAGNQPYWSLTIDSMFCKEVTKTDVDSAMAVIFRK
jgi:hypothetical protein